MSTCRECRESMCTLGRVSILKFKTNSITLKRKFELHFKFFLYAYICKNENYPLV